LIPHHEFIPYVTASLPRIKLHPNTFYDYIKVFSCCHTSDIPL
jgi:hypothetical protein